MGKEIKKIRARGKAKTSANYQIALDRLNNKDDRILSSKEMRKQIEPEVK